MVATPPVAHRDQIVEALEAGAWVWCEKPPTLSLAEYDQIAAAEREGRPYAAVCFSSGTGRAPSMHER